MSFRFGRLRVQELAWLFDLPLWQLNGVRFRVSPQQVRETEGFPDHLRRVMAADLGRPVHLVGHNRRLVVLDGFHRLLKAALEGLGSRSMRWCCPGRSWSRSARREVKRAVRPRVRYAGCMRYGEGGGLTAAERARREQVRLAAAELFEAGASDRVVARTVSGVADVGEPAGGGAGRGWPGRRLASRGAGGARCKLTTAQLDELAAAPE